MPDVVPEAVVVSLAWALGHYLWQGAVLAGLLALLLRSPGMTRPNDRYAACITTLLLMVAAPLATFLAVWSSRTEPASAAVAAPVPELGRVSNKPPQHSPIDATVIVAAPPSKDMASPDATTLPPSDSPSQHPSTFEWSVSRTVPWVVFSLWILGVGFLSSRLLGGYVQTVWVRGACSELPPELARRATRISRALRLSGVHVVASPRVLEAIAVGIFTPMVLVPAAWVAELPMDALEAVISHELAHIRRRDLWILLLQRAVETLLFYHPATWWVSQRASLERELCCDELAVQTTGQPLTYARSLETIGRRVSTGSLAALSAVRSVGPTLAASLFGESHVNLLTRIQNVLGVSPRRDSNVAWPVGLLVLGLAAGTSLSVLATGKAAPMGTDVFLSAFPGDDVQPGDDAPEKEAKDREDDRGDDDRGDKERGDKDRDEKERGDRDRGDGDRGDGDRGDGDRGDGDRKETKKRGDDEGDLRDRPAKREFKGDDGDAPRDDGKRKREVEGDDGDRRPVKKVEGDRPRKKPEGESLLRDFKPQTDREEMLFKVIMGLHKELEAIRREIRSERAHSEKREPGKKERPGDGDAFRKGPRDGDVIRKGPREGDAPVKKGPRAGDGFRREGDRVKDGDVILKGPREGDSPVKKGPREGDEVKREGDRGKEGDARKREVEKDRDDD